MVINIHAYFFLDRKSKLKHPVVHMQGFHQAEWTSVCFDEKKNQLCTYFS